MDNPLGASHLNPPFLTIHWREGDLNQQWASLEAFYLDGPQFHLHGTLETVNFVNISKGKPR
jgi:hypothetical protein